MSSKLPPLRLTVGLSLSALFILLALRFVPTVSSRTARLEQDLERKFLQHQTLQLDARTVSQQVRETGRLSLATSDLSFDLELVPHDLRAPGYRAEEFGAGGVARAIDIGPVRTFRGRARGSQGGSPLPQLGEARFTIDDNRIEGLIITPTEHYFVESARKFSEAALTSDYVLYRESDVTTSAAGECRVTLSEEVNHKNAQVRLATPAVSEAAALLSLQVATEADHEYVTSKGGAAKALAEILSIMNKVEGLYAMQLGLTLKVSYQSARSSSDQPYTSTNASVLLGQLAQHWNINKGSVGRDLVHMWTGKTLDHGTIGTAYLEALCRYTSDGRAAYGLSKGFLGDKQIAITAHEIGHNIGATHPDQQTPSPTECTNTVMSSNFIDAPQLDFCQYSVDEIATYLSKNTSCLNTDTTHFSFALPKALPVGPGAAVSGDFNGDGKDDIAGTSADGLTVMLGSDNGNFSPVFNHPGGGASAVGDFNNDGKLDLLGGGATAYRGTGTGTFETAGASPGGGVVSDFNLDGNLDLASLQTPCCDGKANVSVRLGSGSFSFGPPLTSPPVERPNAFHLLVGRFNNDEFPDLAVAHSSPTFNSSVSILVNDGSGLFQLAGSGFLPTSLPSVTAADFNGDGFMDVAASLSDHPANPDMPSRVVIFFGGDTDGIASIGGVGVSFRHPGALTAGDFNGDGNQDLVVVPKRLATGIEIYHGTGTGSFFPRINYNVPLGSMVVGDFNGDGNQDLINGASVMFGSSTGLQGPRGRVHTFPTALAAADFNHDGKQDLVVSNTWDRVFFFGNTPAGVSVLFGTGTGDFEGSIRAATLSFVHITDVATGDFNNDGLPDIAITSPLLTASGGGVAVIFGTNTGFEAPVNYLLTFPPSAIATADFNNDGKLDLLINGNNELRLMLGGDGGVFQPLVNAATPGGSDLAIGDFNGDTILDVAATSLEKIRMFFGTGTGSFSFFREFDGAGERRTIAAADFNFDGKMDLAIGGVNVLIGLGNGAFQAPILLGGGGDSGLVAADFNSDTKPDIAAAFGSLIPVGIVNNGSFTVLLNTTGNSLAIPSNDNFSAARLISGPNGSITGSTVLATKEVGEVGHTDGLGEPAASIWYQWKAPSTGKFYFQTFSSSFSTVIAVYTGNSVNALTNVKRSTTAVPEYVEVDATVDTTYYIAIDGLSGDTGRTVLTWNTGSLENNDLVFAREIRGTSGSVNGNNQTYDLEPNEFVPDGPTPRGFSAWYRWTAPNTGKVRFVAEPPAETSCLNDTHRVLGAYTDVLTLVAINYDGYREVHDTGTCDNRSLRFNAVAGTTYRIQLLSGAGKPFTLKWNYVDPPPNDNFASALILAGTSGSLVGTNKDATKEPGEPLHPGGPGGASIWYRWTAPSDGEVTFDTIGFRNQGNVSFKYLKALMAVYTGTQVNALTSVVTNATDNKVTFDATAGTTYHISIDSAPDEQSGLLPGIVPLHWGTKKISNDSFVNAQPLTAVGSFSPQLGSNENATKETGEPNHQGNAGGTSVWYRWTALTDGPASFEFNTCGGCTLSASNALIGIYTGSRVNALTPVAVTSANNKHAFLSVRGTTYFIAVDSNAGTDGTYEFSLVSRNISAGNDRFDKARLLRGNSGSVADDNSDATKENNEPDHATDKGGSSVWYQWQAPESGLYTFDTFGSNFDTLLSVYTGTSVGALSRIASSDNSGSSAQSRVTFDAKKNTIYRIAVDGKNIGTDQGTSLSRAQTGFILLSWNDLPPPPNDNFASAHVLSGIAGNVTGRNTVASKEGGEPNHANHPGGVSVWYQWTAPATGIVTFNTLNSDFNTLLSVYTGTDLRALTPVSGNDDVGGLKQSHLSFNSVAGTVYYIAVDGSAGVPGSVTQFTGNVVLSWFPQSDGGNDSFARSQILSGDFGSVAGTNEGAGKEIGEPDHAGDRGGRSLWYSWTAPFSGPVLLSSSGSDFDTVLAVYTGENVGALTAVTSNNDSPYTDNLSHILTSSLTFTATAGATYRIAVDGSGGRSGNFALRWGREAKISGSVLFLGSDCDSEDISIVLEGEDARAVRFKGSNTFTFEHLRIGGNYTVRGISVLSQKCLLPLFLERAKTYFPLEHDESDAIFQDDGLRGGGSTSNISGHVKNAFGIGINNVTVTLTGTASKTVYTDSSGLYQLPNLPEGTYLVTPSKAGMVFSPSSKPFPLAQGQSILEANFVTQDSYNISGQTRVQNGQPLADVTVTLSNGTQAVTVLSDSNGFYSFDAAAGGNYTLSAAKSGLTLAPVDRPFPQLGANQKNVDFTVTTTASTPSGQNVSVQLNGVTVTFSNVTGAGNTNITPISPGTAGTLPNGFQLTSNSLAFDISTTATIQPPITVCFNVPSITNPMEFAQLRVLHSEAGVMVDRTSSHDFTTKTICATVDSLSAFVITSSIIQVLLDESGPGANQAAAVDAVLMFRDPFPLVNTANPFTVGPDRNTRVLIFLRNFKLAAGETPTAVMIILTDGSNQHHEIVAENVFSAPGFDFSQVRFRLPDTLAPGLCTIQVRAHDQMTNVGTVRIRP